MRMPVSAALVIWAALDLAAFSGGAMARLSGPADLPPASYQGLQFVDSRGCLFLRAGFGAQTVWVPMVDESKAQICGMTPSFGKAQTAAPAAAVPAAPKAARPAPAPVAAAAPPRAAVAAPATVTAPAPAAAPVAARAVPARSYQVAALGTTTASCAADAPVLERVLLRRGGTALVCTRGDGTLTGWTQPIFPGGAGVGAALGYATATPENMRGARIAVPAATAVQPAAAPTRAAPVAPTAPQSAAQISAEMAKPPKGWKFAWKDDRLNPMRGMGTAEGQAQMDARWTREVPANLVAQRAQPLAVALPNWVSAPVTAQPVTRVSTMSAPAPKPAQGSGHPVYVQIGSFAVAANASGAAAQIAALGLPAATSPLTRGGGVLQVVYAGPFTDAGAAQSALATLRSAGFRDAIIR